MRNIIALVVFCIALPLFADEKPIWNFTEEEIRLFDPPQNATPEEILQWAGNLERPTPEDTSPWGGFDAYRKMVMQMQIRLTEQILAENPSFELERSARYAQWFPYYLLCEYDKDTWLPKVKQKYEELCRLSRQQGETIDERTALYFSLRESTMRIVIKYEPTFLSEGEKAVAEIDVLLEKHPFGKYSEDLYSGKHSFLSTMAKTDPKYKDRLEEYSATMRQFLEENEAKLITPRLFFFYHSGMKSDTPEGAEYGKKLIEKFKAMIDSNAETRRFDQNGVDELRWRLYALYHELFSKNVLDSNTLESYG